MNRDDIIALLSAVAEGRASVTEAVGKLEHFPSVELEDVTLDTHRRVRQGMPEIVYGRNKAPAQIITALEGLSAAHGSALATMVMPEVAKQLTARFPHGHYDATSRLFRLGMMPPRDVSATVAVVCAGTSDLPVAEEAAQTLEFAGWTAHRVKDVGVSGLHRLISKLEEIRACRAVIVVAGMEGALPSVVAGLVSLPVIAVPTSVGYGASFHGLAALLAMLNACASGIGVVNIDNGFGAAMLAIRMLQTGFPAPSGFTNSSI